MRVSVNGATFERALSVRVSRSVGNFVGWFDVQMSVDITGRAPIKVNDRIEIFTFDGVPLMTGFVDRASVRYAAGQHTVGVSGRDVTSTLVDSSMRNKHYSGPIAFAGLINRVMGDQGTLFPLFVEATGLPGLKETDEAVAEIGETVMEFLDRYAQHVGAVITTNGEGNVVVMRTGQTRSGYSIINDPGDPSSNVLEAALDKNFSDRFAEYSCRSQISTVAGEVTTDPELLVDQQGEATDSAARSDRFHEFEAETSLDTDLCRDRAALEANLRAAESLAYVVTVQGVQDQLQANRLVSVRDTICGIADDLLISAVDYNFGSDGSTTTVNCTFANSYSLQTELSAAQAARSSNAGAF